MNAEVIQRKTPQKHIILYPRLTIAHELYFNTWTELRPKTNHLFFGPCPHFLLSNIAGVFFFHMCSCAILLPPRRKCFSPLFESQQKHVKKNYRFNEILRKIRAWAKELVISFWCQFSPCMKYNSFENKVQRKNTQKSPKPTAKTNHVFLGPHFSPHFNEISNCFWHISAG